MRAVVGLVAVVALMTGLVTSESSAELAAPQAPGALRATGCPGGLTNGSATVETCEDSADAKVAEPLANAGDQSDGQSSWADQCALSINQSLDQSLFTVGSGASSGSLAQSVLGCRPSNGRSGVTYYKTGGQFEETSSGNYNHKYSNVAHITKCTVAAFYIAGPDESSNSCDVTVYLTRANGNCIDHCNTAPYYAYNYGGAGTEAVSNFSRIAARPYCKGSSSGHAVYGYCYYTYG